MKTGPVRPLAFAAGLVLAFALLANAAAAMPFHVGVLGGIGFARLRGPASPVATFEGIKGACYGVTLRFPLAPAFAVQPEVLAVTDGLSFGHAELTDAMGNVLGTIEFLHVLDRIQLPVLLRVTPPAPLRVRPLMFAGPWVATRLREYSRTTGARELTVTEKLLAASDYGITLGGGLQAKAGPGQAELQVRWDAGLKGLGQYYGTGSARTGALRVMAGWSF